MRPTGSRRSRLLVGLCALALASILCCCCLWLPCTGVATDAAGELDRPDSASDTLGPADGELEPGERPEDSSSSNDDSASPSSLNETLNCDAADKPQAAIEPALLRHLFASVYLLIMMFGLAGNVYTLHVALTRRERATVIDAFVANLALSDLLLCVFVVPITPIYTLYYEHWVFGLALCKTVAFAQSLSVYISTFTLIVIAYARFQLICYPHLNQLNRRQASLVNIATWLLAVLVTLPYLMHIGLSPEQCPNKYCDEQWDEPNDRFIFSCVTLLLQLFMPSSAVSYYYGRISSKLREQRLKHHKMSASSASLLAAATGAGCTGRRSAFGHRQLVAGRLQQQAKRGSLAAPVTALSPLSQGPARPASSLAGQTPAQTDDDRHLAGQGSVSEGNLSSCSADSASREPASCRDGHEQPRAAVSAPTGAASVGADCHQSAGPIVDSPSTGPPALGPAARQRSQSSSVIYSMGLGVAQARASRLLKKLSSSQVQSPASGPRRPASGRSGPAGSGAVASVAIQQANGQQAADIQRLLEVAGASSADVLLLRELRLKEKDRKLTQTNRKLVYMVVLFVVSWLPLNLFNLLQDSLASFSESPYVKHYFVLVHMVACFSVCYNPILYAWMSDNYRQELRDILPGCLGRWLLASASAPLPQPLPTR